MIDRLVLFSSVIAEKARYSLHVQNITLILYKIVQYKTVLHQSSVDEDQKKLKLHTSDYILKHTCSNSCHITLYKIGSVSYTDM